VDAAAWDERYASAALVWGAEPNRFLPPEVAGLPAGRGADLACGEGRNAIWLAAQGWSMTGVDFSAVAIGKARELADAQGVSVDFEVADVVTHRLEAVHDLVIVFYLQLAPPERAAVLANAAGGLASGGTFLMVAHDRDNIEHGHGGPQDPLVLPTAELIVTDLLASPAGGPASRAGAASCCDGPGRADRARLPRPSRAEGGPVDLLT
jgi:SAM-dependent methyltransferase